jgi:nicotinate-nucleotide adenylyltransferase
MSETGGTLGIFGGTFDPPHIAHLRLAIEARETLALDQIVFVPAGSPPLRDAPQAAPQDRLAMVERAIADLPYCHVDAGEIFADAPSYTVLTLERLRRQHGAQRPLVLLLGADAFARLPAWHRWRELFALAHVGVATRPGHALPSRKVGAGGTASAAWQGEFVTELAAEYATRLGNAADLAQKPAGRIVPFDITPLDVSATLIRRLLADGRDARHLVSAPVLDYIDSHAIYRTSHGH